jgi:Predicted nucleotide-binding protein containing TIR-like domain
MSEQAPPQEETPLLELMRRLISRGESLLMQAQVPPGPAVMVARAFRARLVRIYGKDSPLLASFRPLPSAPTSEQAHNFLSKHVATAKRVVELLETMPELATRSSGNRVFIGHGRSPAWRELKDFVSDRLGLPWEEFNREAVAGYATSERLRAMLDQSAFAFLVMTAEEEHADARLHARPNVIHEVGLFQGRLGMPRAIILLEDGCSEFSNIVGLSQIRFPRGYISACFEEVRRVLEREGLI